MKFLSVGEVLDVMVMRATGELTKLLIINYLIIVRAIIKIENTVQ